MATNWKGYLLTYADDTTGAKAFPMRYIAAESWNAQPNNREEIKAYRDDNTRNLTRVTASGKKTSISFETLDGLSLEEKIALLKWFTDKESDHLQRKISLRFWNDEESTYKTGTFYRANTEYSIQTVSAGTITYSAIKFDLVEY